MAILRVKDNDGNVFEIPAIKGDKGDDGRNGADGYTPSPAENGNWSINGVDTGKPWKGEKGEKGDTGTRMYFGSYIGDGAEYDQRRIDIGVKADAVLVITQEVYTGITMNGLQLRGGYVTQDNNLTFKMLDYPYTEYILASLGDHTLNVLNYNMTSNNKTYDIGLNKKDVFYQYIAFVNEG